MPLNVRSCVSQVINFEIFQRGNVFHNHRTDNHLHLHQILDLPVDSLCISKMSDYVLVICSELTFSQLIYCKLAFKGLFTGKFPTSQRVIKTNFSKPWSIKLESIMIGKNPDSHTREKIASCLSSVTVVRLYSMIYREPLLSRFWTKSWKS